ncbi:MAG TPA: DinB family protein [Terracidiphilus sp.]|jgi:hypothetical protein
MKPAPIQFAITLLAAASCCCAAVTHAQMSPAPAPADPLQSLTQVVTRFENNLLALAEAMPADKFNFAPTKDTFAPASPAEFATVRTFAQQLTHVSGEPFRLLAPFGVKPDADVDVKSFDSLSAKDEIIKALKASFEYQDKVIAGITPENAFTPAGPRNLSRVAALVAILNDDGDHYGQMVEYLRMNGITPPATVNQQRRAAQAPQQN